MNKHFVILPDGVKATRNSQNRTYTHAIAVSPLAADVAIEQFTNRLNEQREYQAEAEVRLAEIKEHGVTIKEEMGFNTAWAAFYCNGKKVYLANVHQFGTITEEEATAIAELKAE